VQRINNKRFLISGDYVDKVITACCIALMLSGMIFGVSLNSDSETLDVAYKVFGVVSGLAASLTILVALKALSVWREQFFHNMLYEKMTELESIGRHVISSVEQRKLAQEQLRLSTDDEYYEGLNKQANINFRDYIEKYRLSVDCVYPLLNKSQEDNFAYTYVKFSQQAHKLLCAVDSLFKGEFNQDDSNKVEGDVLAFKLKFKDDFRRYWRR
jgi:hypothetical protein